MPGLNISVCILRKDNSWDYLYENISTWEEADLIAQYAMNMRTDVSELIFVFPGWNRGIDNDPELWAKACKLAKDHIKYVKE